jgi:short-subunit dehydrogenase
VAVEVGQSITDHISRMTKFVASRTLREPLTWNATLLKGDVAKEVRKLKQQAGKNILIYGSLIDVYRIMLYPLALGGEGVFFRDGGDKSADAHQRRADQHRRRRPHLPARARNMTTHDRPENATALVTGATGGIGLELARLLAADGFHLILVGRRRDRLDRVAAELGAAHRIGVQVESRDLSEHGAASRLWSDLASRGVRIDGLINNAGVGLYGALDEQDPVELDRMVQLNVSALTTLTRLALPGMRERRWGRILNLASVVGFQPGAPYMAAYYATKAYVLSFSKGLALEVRGSGVSVTALSPGGTETDFDSRARAGNNVLFRRLPKLSAATVARAGYAGMLRGSMVVMPGLLTKLLSLAGELPPRRIALEVNRVLWTPRS